MPPAKPLGSRIGSTVPFTTSARIRSLERL